MKGSVQTISESNENLKQEKWTSCLNDWIQHQKVLNDERNPNCACSGQTLVWNNLYTFETKPWGSRICKELTLFLLSLPLMINPKKSVLIWGSMNTLLPSGHYTAAELSIKLLFNDDIVRLNKVKSRLIVCALHWHLK